MRNEDWHSDLNLYKSGVKLNPNNPKMHNNYAMELKNAGVNVEAEKHYFKALEIEPDYADSYFNLGNLYADLSEFKYMQIYPLYYSLRCFKGIAVWLVIFSVNWAKQP